MNRFIFLLLLLLSNLFSYSQINVFEGCDKDENKAKIELFKKISDFLGVNIKSDELLKTNIIGKKTDDKYVSECIIQGEKYINITGIGLIKYTKKNNKVCAKASFDMDKQKRQWENDWINANEEVIRFYKSTDKQKYNYEKFMIIDYCREKIDKRTKFKDWIGRLNKTSDVITKIENSEDFIPLSKLPIASKPPIDTLLDLYYLVLHECRNAIDTSCYITFHKPKLIKNSNNIEGYSNFSTTIKDGIEVFARDLFKWKINTDWKKGKERGLENLIIDFEFIKKNRYFFHSTYKIDTVAKNITFHYFIKDLHPKAKNTIVKEGDKQFPIKVFENITNKINFIEFDATSPKGNGSTDEALFNIINKPQSNKEILSSLCVRNEISGTVLTAKEIQIVKKDSFPTGKIDEDALKTKEEIIENCKLDTSSNKLLRIIYAKDEYKHPYKVLELVEKDSLKGNSEKMYLAGTSLLHISFQKFDANVIKLLQFKDVKYVDNPTTTILAEVESFSYSPKITVKQYCLFLNTSNVNENGFRDGKPYVFIDYRECPIEYKDGQFIPKTETDNKPVNYVSWYGANAFCNWYGNSYRLPSELEHRRYFNSTNEDNSLTEWCEDDYFAVWKIKDKLNFGWQDASSIITQYDFYRHLAPNRNKEPLKSKALINNYKEDDHDDYVPHRIVKKSKDENKTYIYYPYTMRKDIGFRIVSPS